LAPKYIPSPTFHESRLKAVTKSKITIIRKMKARMVNCKIVISLTTNYPRKDKSKMKFKIRPPPLFRVIIIVTNFQIKANLKRKREAAKQSPSNRKK